MMKLPRWNIYFFLALLLGVGFVVFRLFEPFLTSMLVAAVLAIFFGGMHRFLERQLDGRRVLAAAITLLIIALIIVIPLAIISLIAISEISRLLVNFDVHSISWNSLGGLAQTIDGTSWWQHWGGGRRVEEVIGLQTVLGSFQNVSGWALSFLTTMYQDVAGFVFFLFSMFFALFYFLIDGARAMRFLLRVSPLRDEHEQILIRDFVSMSRATIKGTIIIAFIQGILGSIAFAIAGIASPAVWGLAMAFFSLIPFLGSGIVWLPAAIIMLATGNVWQGVFLLVFGFGVVSSIDNFLRPRFVGKDTQIHPLLVLFATLGGLSMFGIIGFLVGPIIVALFVSLVHIYDIEFKSELSRFNQ